MIHSRRAKKAVTSIKDGKIESFVACIPNLIPKWLKTPFFLTKFENLKPKAKGLKITFFQNFALTALEIPRFTPPLKNFWAHLWLKMKNCLDFLFRDFYPLPEELSSYVTARWPVWRVVRGTKSSYFTFSTFVIHLGRIKIYPKSSRNIKLQLSALAWFFFYRLDFRFRLSTILKATFQLFSYSFWLLAFSFSIFLK